MNYACAGNFFGCKRFGSSNPKDNQENRLGIDHLISTLFSKAKNVLENHAKKFSSKPKQQFASDLVNVSTENGNIKGRVCCTFCEPGVSIGSVGIFFKLQSNGGFWIMSNMNKHLTKYHGNQAHRPKICTVTREHKMAQNKNKPKLPENAMDHNHKNMPISHSNHNDDVSANESLLGKLDVDKKTTKIDRYDTKNAQNGQSCCIASGNISEVSKSSRKRKMSPSKDEHYDQTVELSIEAVVPDLNQMVSHDDSSSCLMYDDDLNRSTDSVDEEEIKGDALYSQVTLQIIKMSNAAANNHDVLHEVSRNNTVQMKYVKMKPDGNCMLAAIVHQLFQRKVNSHEHDQLVGSMRKKVVEHIEANISSYIACIKSRLKEITDDIENDCLVFVQNYLSKKNYWCGVETIKAVSEMYDVNIGTVTNDGMCSMIKPFNPNCSQTLLIFYTNGNHYDSIIDLPESNILLLIDRVIQSEEKISDLKKSQMETVVIL